MVFKITGFKFGTFTDDNGKRVDYSNVFVTIPISKSNDYVGDGYYTQKISVGRVLTAEDMRKIASGSRNIDIVFDMFGKVVSCCVLNPK